MQQDDKKNKPIERDQNDTVEGAPGGAKNVSGEKPGLGRGLGRGGGKGRRDGTGGGMGRGGGGKGGRRSR